MSLSSLPAGWSSVGLGRVPALRARVLRAAFRSACRPPRRRFACPPGRRSFPAFLSRARARSWSRSGARSWRAACPCVCPGVLVALFVSSPVGVPVAWCPVCAAWRAVPASRWSPVPPAALLEELFR